MTTNYARGAARICRNPLFREYFTTLTGEAIVDAAAAADALRRHCGVESRRELLSGSPAGERFLELLEAFNDWLRGRRDAQA